jgi:hypothetical protein
MLVSKALASLMAFPLASLCSGRRTHGLLVSTPLLLGTCTSCKVSPKLFSLGPAMLLSLSSLNPPSLGRILPYKVAPTLSPLEPP